MITPSIATNKEPGKEAFIFFNMKIIAIADRPSIRLNELLNPIFSTIVRIVCIRFEPLGMDISRPATGKC